MFFGGNGDVGPVEITGKMCEKGVKCMAEYENVGKLISYPGVRSNPESNPESNPISPSKIYLFHNLET